MPCLEPVVRRPRVFGYSPTGSELFNMSKVDQAVLERRLRPIYDALDFNNPKKGLQEAEKILKKHPDTKCAKVLKALCLIRTEKLPEAMSIIDALDVDGAKHDSSTLQAFVHCFKEADIPERINRLYERAVDAEPTEHNLSQLFMAYTRTREYKKQQMTGLRLFKAFNHKPYYYWTIMSIIMQAIENEQLAEKMLLPLAEKMFTTQIQKTGYTEGTAAEVEIEFLIKESMRKWEECLALLEQPQTKQMAVPRIFQEEKKANYLRQLGRFEELKKLAEKQIDDIPDNWTMWKFAIEATLELAKKDAAALESLREFNKKHVANATKKARGPLMARMELIRVTGADGIDEAVFDFITKFYMKPSCYNDIQMYFDLVDKKALMKRLDEWMEGIVQQDDEKETKVWAIITYERLRRAFGEKAEQRQQLQQLIAQIAQPARSDLAMAYLTHLAVSMLWDDWRKNNDEDKLYEMILLLEYVASHNQTDPMCKLALIRIYAHMGNTARVTALVKLLDIKSVQNDSLGYLTFPIFELAGRFNLAIIVNTKRAMVYEEAEKDIMETVVNAYKNGKFANVPRLIELEQRMRRSAQAVACDVLNRYLSSLFVIDDLENTITTCYGDEEPIDWENLVDNRDLNVLPFTEPQQYSEALEDMKERTYREFIDITKMRHFICRTIAAIGRLTREGVDKEESRKQLNAELEQLTKHVDQCKKVYNISFLPSRLLQSPAPMHLSQWLHSGGLEIFLKMVSTAQNIVKSIDEGKSDCEELIEEVDKFGQALKKIGNVYDGKKKHEGYFWMRMPILAASRALQTMAAVQICLKLILRVVMRNGEANEVKTKKGKKEAPVNSLTKKCEQMEEEVKKAAKALQEQLEQLMKETNEEDFLPTKVAEDMGQAKLVLETCRPVVDSRIRRSYVMAIEDMITTISSRF